MLELLASDYRPIVQEILSVSLIAGSIIWGSGPERAVALTWLFSFEILGLFDDLLTGPDRLLTDVDFFLAAKDLVAGALWITIALYANRNYTLWIAGMQLLAMGAHLARGLVEAISPITYATMVIAPGWFQLLLLGIGLSRHILRKRKYGRYRDWRNVELAPPGSPMGRLQRRIIAVLGYDFFEKRESNERAE